MTHSRKLIAELDEHYPPCGPCAICGGPDKRHRLWDSLIGYPDDDEATAANFDVTVEHVRAVRRIRPYRRKRRDARAAE